MTVYFDPPYPGKPPRAFVTPTSEMRIKDKHQHCDRTGMVYLPYLNQWNSYNSTCAGLFACLQEVLYDRSRKYKFLLRRFFLFRMCMRRWSHCSGLTSRKGNYALRQTDITGVFCRSARFLDGSGTRNASVWTAAPARGGAGFPVWERRPGKCSCAFF